MSVIHHTVPVALQARSYDILVGEELLPNAARWIAPLLTSKRAIIITDQSVGFHYAAVVTQALVREGIRCDTVSIKPGEGSKSFTSYARLMEDLLKLQPDRKTTLLALGGGVVGDIAGFAASTLLRGVPFIQIPTSLLAQVDSSVGGKTAINAKAGKNLVGSFYQPRLVLADIQTLATLPVRQLRAGYAEIIKYGLILDEAFYRWCLANGEALIAGNRNALAYAIARSCQLKAQVVAADEREQDARALLNFGHTFGHALEAQTGYSDVLLHGEAVAIGMVMACRLSAQLGRLPAAVETELAAHLKAVGLPTSPADIAADLHADAVVAHCYADKKTEGGALTFIVLDAIGQARVQKNVDAELAHVNAAVYMKA